MTATNAPKWSHPRQVGRNPYESMTPSTFSNGVLIVPGCHEGAGHVIEQDHPLVCTCHSCTPGPGRCTSP